MKNDDRGIEYVIVTVIVMLIIFISIIGILIAF